MNGICSLSQTIPSPLLRQISFLRVSGIVNLLENQPDARVILVSAAAYNAAGQPVGARRWESPVGLESGSGLMYDFYVYSLNGPIDGSKYWQKPAQNKSVCGGSHA